MPKKKSIIFINARQYSPLGFNTAPLNFLCLSSNLVAKYNMIFIDTGIDNNWENSLLNSISHEPLCAGVSVMGGSSISYAIRASELIKEASPNIPVVWGGSHPSLFPVETCKELFVDYTIAGEGESSFLKLCDQLNINGDVESIPGLAYKKDDKVSFNEQLDFIDFGTFDQPDLPYQLIDIHKYSDKRAYVVPGAKKVIGIETSRGCPNRCLFCSYDQLSKRKWRPMPLNWVIGQIKILNQKYDIDGFRIVDSNFFLDKNRIRIFCEMLLNNNLKIKWAAPGHIQYFRTFDEELMRLIEKSGCVAISFGAESGSDRILEFYRKQITARDIVDNNIRFNNYRIIPRYSFMVGTPIETMDDINKTLGIITQIFKTNQKSSITCIAIYTPFGGSELYKLCIERYGYNPPDSLEEWATLNFDSGKFPWNSDNRIKLLKKLHFSSFFLSVRPRLIPMNFFMKIVYWILQRLVLFRYKQNFLKFTFEAAIAKYLMGSKN